MSLLLVFFFSTTLAITDYETFSLEFVKFEWFFIMIFMMLVDNFLVHFLTAAVNGPASESMSVVQQEENASSESGEMSVDVLEMALRMASETGDESGRSGM